LGQYFRNKQIFRIFAKIIYIMDKNYRLTNGKTIAEAENDATKAIERLYLDSWAKGIPVAYYDDDRNLHLANPDGSDDIAKFDIESKEFIIISRFAESGKGPFAYLLAS